MQTENRAQTINLDIPESVTASSCMTLSEASLTRLWRPNRRTRWAMFFSRLGIGVHRCRDTADLFRELDA